MAKRLILGRALLYFSSHLLAYKALQAPFQISNFELLNLLRV
jgi:hypothetical protein